MDLAIIPLSSLQFTYYDLGIFEDPINKFPVFVVVDLFGEFYQDI